jgi:hypothetical protein
MKDYQGNGYKGPSEQTKELTNEEILLILTIMLARHLAEEHGRDMSEVLESVGVEVAQGVEELGAEKIEGSKILWRNKDAGRSDSDDNGNAATTG